MNTLGLKANCDHSSEWDHRACACIGIALRCVRLPKSLLAFLLPVCKMQFTHYPLFMSFQVARSMWLLTIHRSFHRSPVIQLVAISGITCVQPRMFPTLKKCKATAAGSLLTCTSSETGSKIPDFSGVVVSGRANQNSMKAPSLFRCLMLNNCCRCHGKRLLSAT